MIVHKCQGHPGPLNIKDMSETFEGNEMCIFVFGLKGAGQQTAFPNAFIGMGTEQKAARAAWSMPRGSLPGKQGTSLLSAAS